MRVSNKSVEGFGQVKRLGSTVERLGKDLVRERLDRLLVVGPSFPNTIIVERVQVVVEPRPEEPLLLANVANSTIRGPRTRPRDVA